VLTEVNEQYYKYFTLFPSYIVTRRSSLCVKIIVEISFELVEQLVGAY
jgi:hypothetical protein